MKGATAEKEQLYMKCRNIEHLICRNIEHLKSKQPYICVFCSLTIFFSFYVDWSCVVADAFPVYCLDTYRIISKFSKPRKCDVWLGAICDNCKNLILIAANWSIGMTVNHLITYSVASYLK